MLNGKPSGRVRGVGLIAGFLGLTVPAVLIQGSLAAVSTRAARRFPHDYFRTLARFLGIRIHVTGDPVAGKPALWVSNHVSWLDIVILGAVRPVTFVAKTQVSGWPVFGIMARVGRTLFIDRDRRHATGEARTMMQDRLEDGETVVLFAEGTSSDGNRVLPVKSALIGAAEIKADGSPVPVQPVTVAFTHCHGIPMGRTWRPYFAWFGDVELLPHLWGAARRGPLDVHVTFHDPVTVEQTGGRKPLARHCEAAINGGLVASLYRGRAVGARPDH